MTQRLVYVRPSAKEDLESIYFYSHQNFGEDRAIQYIDDLDHAYEKLADDPTLGRSCDYVRKGLFTYQVVSHVVFFRVSNEELTVVRVLHKTMDYQRHF